MKKYKGYISFDFDGVISTYHGWKGFDVLGEPIKEVIKVMRRLKKEDYYVFIFTGRADTPKLREFLKKHKVPYECINQQSCSFPFTSTKPYYQCVVDDRAVNPIDYMSGTIKDEQWLYGEIKEMIDRTKYDL